MTYLHQQTQVVVLGVVLVLKRWVTENTHCLKYKIITRVTILHQLLTVPYMHQLTKA